MIGSHGNHKKIKYYTHSSPPRAAATVHVRRILFILKNLKFTSLYMLFSCFSGNIYCVIDFFIVSNS